MNSERRRLVLALAAAALGLLVLLATGPDGGSDAAKRSADPVDGADGGHAALEASAAPEAVEPPTVVGARAPTDQAGAERAPLSLDLTLRLDPRPAGVPVVFGVPLRPQRVGFDGDVAPEWSTQQPTLAVSLSRRGDGPPLPRTPGVEGDPDVAGDPLQVTWTGVGAGVYDLEVTLRGDAGEAKTALTGIVMGEDGAESRLASWRPQVDFTAMRVSLEHAKDDPDDAPERFVLGVGVGPVGRAFACAPRPIADSDERWLHGPYLVVQRAATAATLFAFEERTGEVSAPIVDGDVTLTLPDRLMLSVDRRDGGPEPGGRGSEIYLVRVDATDEWRPGIPPLGFDFHVIALAGSGHVNQASTPGPGRHRWVFDRGEPATAAFEIPPGDAHPRHTIELLPHR